MPLDSQKDSSWPLGEWQAGAVEGEPGGSAQTITGLLGDDSLPYRRGGSTYKSNAALGAAGLLGVWDGVLVAGRRTLFGSATTIDRLAADDATPQAMFGITAGVGIAAPWKPALVAGSVWFLDSNGSLRGYAGTRVAAASGSFGSGTVTVTNGSKTVTGAGTTWLTPPADSGMFLAVGSGRGIVASVDGNTQITLDRPWDYTTAAGAAYSLVGPSAAATSPDLPFSGSTDPILLASVANRLLVAQGGKLTFSPIGEPWQFVTTDYHSLPTVVGIGSLRDTAIVCTQAGIYAISNMAADLTDAQGNPQQRVDLVNAELIAWNHAGISSWLGSLIVPALDGVWLVDANSAPVRISDRISDLYLSYVRAGYAPGAAEVFNAHYFLPILNGTTWVDTLVCRLQPTLSGGQYAWTQLAGSGAQVAGLTKRSSSPPVLLGASRNTASRITNLTGFFAPASAIKNDADATTHTFRLTTRNIAIGDRPTGVIYMRAWYSLVDAASDSPTITAEASVDGAAYQTLSVTTGTNGGTTAGAQDGSQAVYWAVGLAGRFIRFRFTCTTPAASLQFKQLEFFYRTRGN